MSAFAGIYYLDGRLAEPSRFEAMLRPMERRGPDGIQVWTGGPVGLGHGELYTTPESLHEKQPHLVENGRWAIVADLRLDNRAVLLTQLGADASSSDAALALSAYRKWGPACAEHLLGDFAFAIWDRATRTIFGARDHLGLKPFYYHRQAGRSFVFGSDPSALLTVTDVPRQINEARIADYLVPELEGSDKTSTFYREIFRLPPAHTISVSPTEIQVRAYWALDAAKELRLDREEDYSEAFREIFAEAVNCRLRSAGPVGAMLSGGLDSAAVVGFASHRGSPELKTYSCLRRDASRCCETQFVNAVVRSSKVEATSIYDDEVGQLDQLVEDHFAAGTDLFDFADIPLIAYDRASRDGIRVMLDGVDGDVVTAANAIYLTEVARKGNTRAFLSAASGYADYYGLSRASAAGLIWEQGIKPKVKARLPESAREGWRQLRGQTGAAGPLHWNGAILGASLIDLEFAERIGLAEKLSTLNGDTRWGDRSSRENDAQTLNAPFVTAAIERYDRLAASRSIEARHPFFDKRVVEFCLALPLEIKQSGGWAKMIVRRAAERLVPDEIRWRRHSQANLNQHFFVSLMGPGREQMVSIVRNGLKELSGYVNHSKLSEALAENSVGASHPHSLWNVYQALRLLVWLRRQ